MGGMLPFGIPTPGAQPGTQEELDESLWSEAAGACRPFSLSCAEGNSPQAYPVPAQQRGCPAYLLLRVRWVTKPERLGLTAAPPPVQQELISCTNGTHGPPCEAEFGCDGTFPSLSVVFSNQASESKASGLGNGWGQAPPLAQWQHTVQRPFSGRESSL